VDDEDRRIERRPGLPGSRAVVGALLMALAALGVFVAHGAASEGPTAAFVVAGTDLRPGHRIEQADLAQLALDLPPQVSAQAFTDPGALVGRVVIGPVSAGSLVQRGAVTEGPAAPPAHEVSLVLPRANVAADRLQPGDRLDLFATDPERTRRLLEGATLLAVGGSRGGAIGDEREMEVVVAVPGSEAVREIVHALRTAEVTVVRSTFADPPAEPASDERSEEEPDAAASAPGHDSGS
jgi:Flp pilus assembly protein CpaB